MADLKKNLRENDALIQMDFSENFVCQSAEEIQSAYWNSTSVTLHPVVVYYNCNSSIGKPEHKSFVFVSDVSDHSAKAVVTIIQKLVPLLTAQVPNLATVHYWTDSPSSQYRFIFSTLCRHNDLFGVNACWNYSECGHGKSVCDGIGGTAKRQAADAVKQAKATIQDARDFFSWASSQEKEITYIFYSQEEYEDACRMLSTFDCKPVPGTMHTHAVVPLDQTHLLVWPLSCYCDNYFKGDRCEGWVKRTVQLKIPEVTGDQQVSTAVQVDSRRVVEDHITVPVVGDYVAAMYINQWYLGMDLEIDEKELDTHITFMTCITSKQGERKYRWPQPPDQLWIPYQDVLTSIPPPKSIGRSERFFEVSTETADLIKCLVQSRKK